MMIRGMSLHTHKLSILVLSLLFICNLRLVAGQPPQNNRTTTTIPVDVGVILDLDTWVGQMGLSCINMSLSDFYIANPSYKTRIVLNIRDSKRDNIVAAASALDLIKNKQVQAIIGPKNSMQANFIIDLGDKAHVPIISFSATSSSISSVQSPYFVRAAQNDSSQVGAISALVQAFGWREVIIIYVDNQFGVGIIPSLTDALEQVNARVPYRSAISPSATDDQILKELYKLMMMQTRVFIVHMSTPLSSQLFTKANEIGMMNKGYVWIMTNGITDLLSLVDASVITNSMQGVLGVKAYVPNTNYRNNFTVRWKIKFQQDNPSILNPTLNIFGYWAYDATQALAIAIEKVGATNFSFQSVNSLRNVIDLEAIGVSQIGQQLLQALGNTTFTGLVGNFSLVGGQLESSTFQIININGNAARLIGFWTLENGLMKDLNRVNTTKYYTSKSHLRSIIWPGDSLSIPKGWEVPTNGNKRLKILVPIKEGFREFVTVTQDPNTNTSQVSGYCIDIFQAVIEKLPYAVAYDFVPFTWFNDSSSNGYNDMIDQVFYKNYDAMVGDITITANRSLYVDFTLPYTEAGVAMVVPYIDNDDKNAWVFLKPLTLDLWVTTGCFFVFIALVVWILEHRINEDFRGPAANQIGTSVWFSFSIMVFAQREKVYNNLSRFVIVVWFFVVLIITQSYTASLSSMLVAQNLQPTVTDLDQVLKSKENVGYQYGSFVHGMLKQLGFDDSRLKTYQSPEELDALFSNGTTKGRITVAFDEVPYIKLVLSKYCNKYSMIPTFRTTGFGFVFHKGSPLLPDISRGVLNVTEGLEMMKIEKAWLPHNINCLDPTTSGSSKSMDLASFLGLFLIAGVAALLALLIFMCMFLKSNWNVLTSPRGSLWEKVVDLGRRFYQRDLTSHTFQMSRFRDTYDNDGPREAQVAKVSTNDHCPPSPSYSNNTENNFIDEQGMISIKHDHPIAVDQGIVKIRINELVNVESRKTSNLGNLDGNVSS